MLNPRTRGELRSLYIILGIVCGTVFGTCASCGCFVDDARVIRGIEKLGYSEVEIISKNSWFIGCRGCSEADAARFDIKALNPKGDRVTFFACAGWPFKGVTIRTE